MIKKKTLLIFHRTTHLLVKTIVDEALLHMSRICPIGSDKVWIVGSYHTAGLVVVVDRRTLTIEDVRLRHQGTIYAAVEVGPLIWTSAWDGTIFAWNAKVPRSSLLTWCHLKLTGFI